MRVHALAIDQTNIVYRCPHNCTARYHWHGSEGILKNRVEERCSHCLLDTTKNIQVVIDSLTYRGTIKKTFKKNRKIVIEPLAAVLN
jgi:hypothetical protein